MVVLHVEGGGPQRTAGTLAVSPNSGSTAPYSFTNWVGQDGSDGASNYVASTTGTITYVETGYAKEHDIPCAAVRNASGAYLQPSSYNDAVALESDQLAPNLEQTLSGVFSSTQPNAYPISAYSYLITPEGEIASDKGAVLGQFVKFFACEGQQAAGQLGYSPLPPNLVQDDFDAIRRINGAANPGTVNAQNCPNPYVDGQTVLPGEPVVQGQAATTGSAGGESASGAGVASSSTGKHGFERRHRRRSDRYRFGNHRRTKFGSGHGERRWIGYCERRCGCGPAGAATGPGVQGSAGRAPAGVATSQLDPVALQETADGLLGAPKSLDALWWALGLLAVFVVPPVVLGLRRRRRREVKA